METLGKAANSLLDSIIADGDTVGLAWGETLGTMADVIENVRKKEAVFCALVGGPGKNESRASREHHCFIILPKHTKQIAIYLIRRLLFSPRRFGMTFCIPVICRT
ncbi:sugar-binding domain-containing protein [Sinobaca sp. H24]|uniref:sugar-binding domain-containing protein n=1 Tax=Sinobaca sp. H24 TaxID=2923376 RepID=UPI0035AD7755